MNIVRIGRFGAAAGAVAALALVSTLAQGQTNGTPAKFTAFAVNLSNVGQTGTATLEIGVDQWTSNAEQQRLLDALMNKGADALLSQLRKAPTVGYIRPTTGLGYDLHYARRTPLPEGGERIVLATDRPIGFWEASTQARTMEYPFTVIEMHIDRNGEGQGKLSVATKIIPDKENNIITLENYATQPVMLTDIRRIKASE